MNQRRERGSRLGEESFFLILIKHRQTEGKRDLNARCLGPFGDAKVEVFDDVINRFTGTFLRILKNYPKFLKISRKILKGIKKAPRN